MHCLVGTFIKELPPEQFKEKNIEMWPVKIILTANKSRILYLISKEEQL
jgi:hypothetical protein